MIKTPTRRNFLRLLALGAASLTCGLRHSLASPSTSDVAAPSLLAEKAGDEPYASDIATFQPWVGENYEAAPFANRTLIVGEADYEWEGGDISQCRNVTRDLVADLIAEPSANGRLRPSSWIYIAMLFTNKWPYTLEERRLFWHSVAFYNYLQSPAGFGASGVPTPAQWKESEAAFVDVVRLLKPQVMCLLGERLWNSLPLNRQIWCKDGLPLFLYNYPGGNCLAVPIRNPTCLVHRT